MPTDTTTSGSDASRPDVIVDFCCEHGMLFVLLKNIGGRSAYEVTTTFDTPLLGLGGQKSISDLPLFRSVEFVPPGKEFSQLVDPAASWFKQERPERYIISISYGDRDGRQFNESIIHELSIYRDLGHVRISGSGGTDGNLAG